MKTKFVYLSGSILMMCLSLFFSCNSEDKLSDVLEKDQAWQDISPVLFV